MHIMLDDGKLAFSGVKADVLSGKHTGEWKIDLSGKTPQYSGNGKLEGVSLAQVGDLIREKWMAGSGKGSYELQFSGADDAEMARTMAGTFEFAAHGSVFPKILLPGQKLPLHSTSFAGSVTIAASAFEIHDAKLESSAGSYGVDGSVTGSHELDLRLTRDGEEHRLGGTMSAAKVEVPKVDAAKPDAPHMPGKLMIMSPGERVGADAKVEAASGEGSSGKRRMSAMAAVVALATVAGALGGAMATAGFGHMTSVDSAAANTGALEASIARIDADIVALKAGAEHTSKVATGQFNKTSDRLDKVEKAQVEPAAKLAKLSEAVDKLRAAPAPAPVAAAAPAPSREVTGSVSQPAAVAAAVPAAAPPKPDVARLPRVEGWVLRDVANGGALIEGRQGVFEVYAGDPVPGLGRVDAIRKQDGKWVVVTSKGLISR